MPENSRIYRLTVNGATDEEAGMIQAALRDLQEKADKRIDGTVRLREVQQSNPTDGFARAGDSDA